MDGLRPVGISFCMGSALPVCSQNEWDFFCRRFPIPRQNISPTTNAKQPWAQFTIYQPRLRWQYLWTLQWDLLCLGHHILVGVPLISNVTCLGRVASSFLYQHKFFSSSFGSLQWKYSQERIKTNDAAHEHVFIWQMRQAEAALGIGQRRCRCACLFSFSPFCEASPNVKSRDCLERINLHSSRSLDQCSSIRSVFVPEGMLNSGRYTHLEASYVEPAKSRQATRESFDRCQLIVIATGTVSGEPFCLEDSL